MPSPPRRRTTREGREREGDMAAPRQRETQSLQLEENEAEAMASLKALAVSMDPAAQKLSDFDFLRFLRARDFDIDKSAKLLIQHLKWRMSFVPLGYVKEEEIIKELGRKQIFLQGHDKFGCSIAILLTARHLAYERDLEEVKRLFVYTFDKAAASNLHNEGKFTIIGDMEGWGVKNMDIRGYLAVLDILQNHYPERLRKLLLLHVPYLFWGAWKVVSPLVDKVTREKIVFVDDKRLKDTLLKEIDEDQLPTKYGGQQSLITVQDYAAPNWPPRTAV
eukprot:c9957_g1_i1 orf=357-1187(-)